MNDALRRYLAEGERVAGRYALGLPRIAPVGQAGATLSQRAGASLAMHSANAAISRLDNLAPVAMV